MGYQLHGSQRLVVIGCDNYVEFTGVRPVIKAIRGMRAGNANAFIRTFLDGGKQ